MGAQMMKLTAVQIGKKTHEFRTLTTKFRCINV
nr:MAG TPA: hypothetical protein [Caudoviricetes sp.]